MDIITIEDYKTFAEINSPKSDAKLATIVAMVNEFITIYCNLSLGSEQVIERFTNVDNSFVLGQMPVSSVTSISASGTELPLEDFYLVPGTGVLEYTGSTSISTKPRAIAITYTCGYDTVPNGLKQAAMELVTHYFKREFFADKNLGNGMSLSVHETSNVPAQIRSILDLYRVI